jgi:hypothetical protein
MTIENWRSRWVDSSFKATEKQAGKWNHTGTTGNLNHLLAYVVSVCMLCMSVYDE